MIAQSNPPLATAPKTPLPSWWVGLSRDDLHAAIELRNEQWKRKGVGFLDTIGEKLRDRWI